MQQSMNVLVFDIEAVPDVETGRRLYALEGLTDQEIANIMFTKRYQETSGKSELLRLPFYRVIAISAVLRTEDKLKVWSLGKPESPEEDLIGRFFEGIERYSPVLVSWNGRGFDLPVLHYRALLHGISAPRYWENGDEDPSFRWNNYLSRYHERHTDLMDVLASYDARAVAPLHEVATLLGFPGKLGMNGAEVWERFIAGNIQAIRDYCEIDVLNTYLLYLRYELMRGRQSKESYHDACQRVREVLGQEAKPHFTAFLEAWHT
jgi:3'-5' exonuclease